MRSFFSIIAAPALCLGVLSGIVWENRRHTRPSDAEPFHAIARAAVESGPHSCGNWTKTEKDPELPLAAIQLLKLNAYISRQFVNTHSNPPQSVQLLVVQCRDPIDMSGHYPPNCYPANGSPQKSEKRRDWIVPGLAKPIAGMEYHFVDGSLLNPTSYVVYDFFILPGRGMVAEMDQVREASGDYQRRHYGATQVQVLFENTDMSEAAEAARDNIFISLLAAHADMLRALNPSGL